MTRKTQRKKSWFLIFLFIPIYILLAIHLNSNLVLNAFWTFSKSISFSDHPDIDLNATQLIEKHGYSYEIHEILTQDGYILTYIRICNKGNKIENITRPPVLIHHGFESSSTDFITLGPEKSLPYKLADKYDVWLANARGNLFSRKHISLKTDQREFWNFSIHEMGKYDMPAAINYILDKSGEKSLFLIGHSMGSNVITIALSTYPELNNKVKLAVALGPGIYLENIRSPWFILYSKIAEPLYDLLIYFGSYESLTSLHIPVTNLVGRTICSEKSPLAPLCTLIIFTVVGFNYPEFNQTQLPLRLQHFPFGSSRKSGIHLFQILTSGAFRNYDYGKKLNLQYYGEVTPPEYQIEKIKAPISIFYGENDILTVPKDVMRFAARITNLEGFHKVKAYTHLDFLWANGANILYEKIIKIMQKY